MSGREKDRKLHRKRRRIRKLRKLKLLLNQARNNDERRRIVEKISKTSFTKKYIPET